MAIVKIHYYNNDNKYLKHKLHIIIDKFQKILVPKGKTSTFSTTKGTHNIRIYYVFPNRYIDTQIDIEDDENFYIYRETSIRNNSTNKPGMLYKVKNEEEFQLIYKNYRKFILTILAIGFLIVLDTIIFY